MYYITWVTGSSGADPPAAEAGQQRRVGAYDLKGGFYSYLTAMFHQILAMQISAVTAFIPGYTYVERTAVATRQHSEAGLGGSDPFGGGFKDIK